MKPILYLACLVLALVSVAAAEGDPSSESPGLQPTSGLVDVVGPYAPEGWTRRIRLVLDPQTHPSTYYPSKDDMPGIPEKPVDPMDPAAPFRKELNQIGAEAVIYLAYNGKAATTPTLYVKMLRFSTAKQAETYWALRQKTSEFERLDIVGEEILATPRGKHLRPDLVARLDTLESRVGRYVLRVAPGRPVLRKPGSPEIGDPGLRWILLQSMGIGHLSEQHSAANQSQPTGPKTNRTSSAAGSGR